jgi:hypothetical protein
MLKYQVIDRRTGLVVNDDCCIVTRDGKVAWWDESQGWSEDEHQSRYAVTVTKFPSAESIVCGHQGLVNSIRKDKNGCLFACSDCGMRTRGGSARVWMDPDAPRTEAVAVTQ